jgi:hypothetical protein
VTRPRTTFSARDTLDVRGARDMHLVYGPESKCVWRDVKRRHRIILAQRQEAIEKLLPVYQWCRQFASLGTTNRFIRLAFPELWDATVPWRHLAREGVSELREAALNDTAQQERREAEKYSGVISPRTFATTLIKLKLGVLEKVA